MSKCYVFEWLDILINVTLNPERTSGVDLTEQDMTALTEHINSEKERIQVEMNTTVFGLMDEAEIKCCITKYHLSLIGFLDQAILNQGKAAKRTHLRQAIDLVIAIIDELLLFVESRFVHYLGTDERLPVTVLARTKSELSKRLSLITEKWPSSCEFRAAFEIAIREILAFLDQPTERHALTFEDIAYIRDLCYEMEQLQVSHSPVVYSPLDLLLISMNFNSKLYFQNLIQRMSAHADNVAASAEKLEQLLFLLKVLKQLPLRPFVSFDRANGAINEQLSNWLNLEIDYLERRAQLPAQHPTIVATNTDQKKDCKKILSVLSVDQMALLLRAADDLKVIMSKSLNAVFKCIVPYLSTPYQENISYDSMRSKSYAAETRDKQIVIQTLQQIIAKIDEY